VPRARRQEFHKVCRSTYRRLQLAAFWPGLARLRDASGVDKADLRTFMSDGVAAALSGDAAKATALEEAMGAIDDEDARDAAIATFKKHRLEWSQNLNLPARRAAAPR